MKKTFLTMLAVAGIFTACEKDEIDSLNNSLNALESQVAANNQALTSALDMAVASLEVAIADGDAATIASAGEALAAEVEAAGEITADLQSQIDALEGVSAAYDEETGIVSITLANGTIFQTGDLRGEDGQDGRDGRDGVDGADGQDGVDGVNGVDGTNGTDGVDGQDGVGGGGAGLTETEINDLIALAIAAIPADDYQAQIDALQAAIDALPVDDDSHLATIEALNAAIADLQSQIDVLNGTDEIIFSDSAAVLSGGVSSTVNDGDPVISYKIGASTYATLELAKASVGAGETVTIVTVSTQAILINTTAQISTVTRTYSLKQNGALDVPALEVPAAEAISTEVAAASSVSGAAVSTDGESISYTAPAEVDPTDTFSEWSEWIGADPGYGEELTKMTAVVEATFANDSIQYGTKTWNDVVYQAAYTYEQTRTRTIIQNGDLDDPAPVGELSQTQTVEVEEYIKSVTPNSEQVLNPNYEEPDNGFTPVAVSETISGLFGLKDVKLNGVAIEDAAANGETVTFTANEAGTYTVTYFASSIKILLNSPDTVTITVNEDGTVTQG